MPPKLKPQKAPAQQKKKEDKQVGIEVALDRVRKQLRRDAMKQKESSQKQKKAVSSEEKKILDKIKQIEDTQRRHELKKNLK